MIDNIKNVLTSKFLDRIDNTIKSEYIVPNPMTIHSVSLILYNSYEYAELLMIINRLTNQNLKPNQVIYYLDSSTYESLL